MAGNGSRDCDWLSRQSLSAPSCLTQMMNLVRAHDHMRPQNADASVDGTTMITLSVVTVRCEPILVTAKARRVYTIILHLHDCNGLGCDQQTLWVFCASIHVETTFNASLGLIGCPVLGSGSGMPTPVRGPQIPYTTGPGELPAHMTRNEPRFGL